MIYTEGKNCPITTQYSAALSISVIGHWLKQKQTAFSNFLILGILEGQPATPILGNFTSNLTNFEDKNSSNLSKIERRNKKQSHKKI